MNGKSQKRDSHSTIDAHLKRAFQKLSDEAVPDRFAMLLQRLKETESSPGAAGSEEVDKA